MTTTRIFAALIAALLLTACQDAPLLVPELSPQEEASPARITPGETVPFTLQTTSTAVWLEAYVADVPVSPGEAPTSDPDLAILTPVQFLGMLMQLQQTGSSPLVWNQHFEGRCVTPSLAAMHFTVEGRGTHLGRITGEGSHCYYVPGVYGEGEFTAVAANGDELTFVYYDGSGVQIADDYPLFRFEDDVSIVAGTGRFENASGSGHEVGIFDFITGVFDSEVRGAILYDASNRAH